MKIVKANRVETPSAALWTPWGIQQPAERDAQKASARRLLRKIAEMRRRQKAEPAPQQA